MDSKISIVSTTLLLFFILDPFGNIPVLLTLLRDYNQKKRIQIIIREVLIGLFILLIFLFLGEQFLNLFHLETEAIGIAGGIIFFIFGIKMIFPTKGEEIFSSEEEPIIVPIALPMIAGPSALATLILLAHNNPHDMHILTLSLILAWLLTSIIFVLSPHLYKILKNRGLTAMERLMGMLLLIMSIQMFIDGIRAVFHIQ